MNEQARRPGFTTPTILEQRATALVEIQQMHLENETLRKGREEDHRTIQNLNDRNALIFQQYRDADTLRKVAERKLYRLATAMKGINAMTAEATEIMRDVVDWQETEEEAAAETESARRMAQQLAPPVSDRAKGGQ